jgi:hypothetical protein
MGLNVSHNAFNGAYSAFNRFREAVCKATGGHWCDEISGYDYWKFGEGYTSKSHPGLYEFLKHSDCDGEISSELAAKCADEMEALLPALEAQGDGGGHLSRNGGYAGTARKWIEGCRQAAADSEELSFS